MESWYIYNGGPKLDVENTGLHLKLGGELAAGIEKHPAKNGPA